VGGRLVEDVLNVVIGLQSDHDFNKWLGDRTLAYGNTKVLPPI
jgi:hypothetical protein